MTKTKYEMFLEKSELTLDEANAFLGMKLKQVIPPSKDEDIDMKFVNDLSKEAKKWKKEKPSRL
jgi:hypothetical protein